MSIKCCTNEDYDSVDPQDIRDYHDDDVSLIAVHEPISCSYYMKICSKRVCSSYTSFTNSIVHDNYPQPAEQEEESHRRLNEPERTRRNVPSIDYQNKLLERVREMFTYAYDSYLDRAFPLGDLKPLSCTGTNFDLIKIPLVTLIDGLDTLVIMNNFTEFRR